METSILCISFRIELISMLERVDLHSWLQPVQYGKSSIFADEHGMIEVKSSDVKAKASLG